MRRLLLLLVLVAAVGLTGCRAELPRVESMAVVEADYPPSGDWPQRVVVAIEVDNAGRAFRLLGGRLRIGIEGRRSVVLTLEQRVRVGRGQSEVLLPLRVSVARSSQSLRLREMIRRGESEGLQVDWQLRLRSGLTYIEREEPLRVIDELLSAEQRQALMEFLKEI